MGPAYQLRDISQRTLLQTIVNSNLLPKVQAAFSTINSTVFGISIFVIGGLTDLIGVKYVYIYTALLLLIATFIGYRTFRKREKE